MYFDQSTDSWTLLEAGVTDLYYAATGLIPGALYKFRVQARNSIGYSANSEFISLYAAVKPNAPTTVATTELNNKINLSWVPADVDSFTAYGSAVSSYVVEIL